MRLFLGLSMIMTLTLLGCGDHVRTIPAATTGSTTALAPSASVASQGPTALPTRFLAATNALKASVEKVTSAIKSAKDCDGVADAMDAFTNDPSTAKQITAYFGELMLLVPEQTKIATSQNGDLTSKLTTIGIDRTECTKTPRTNAALKAMSDMETSAMAAGSAGGH